MEKQKINYQKQFYAVVEKIGAENSAGADRPSLLLHACCAPCSSHVIEQTARYFDVTLFYYNPNIAPPEEYRRRLSELQGFLPRFPAAVRNGVKLVAADYNPDEYYNAVGTKENPALAAEAEKGERCRRCYYFRMKKAYEYAAKNQFDWFTTTLSVSPFKDAEKINAIGAELAATETRSEPRFLPSDFKKKNGFLRSLELSREYGLYRQQYCGCVYSKANSVRAV